MRQVPEDPRITVAFFPFAPAGMGDAGPGGETEVAVLGAGLADLIAPGLGSDTTLAGLSNRRTRTHEGSVDLLSI